MHLFHRIIPVLMSILSIPFLILWAAGSILSRIFTNPFPPKLIAVKRPIAPKRSEKTMDEVMSLLEDIPLKPLPIPGILSTALKHLPDLIPFLISTKRSISTFLYPYPREFRHLLLQGEDGYPFSSLCALYPDNIKRPALLILHGLLCTKNFQYVRDIALRAFYNWGFHVMVLDLRDFGDTLKVNIKPSSVGLMEKGDIESAASFLLNTGKVNYVCLLGFSLGGLYVLNASRNAELFRGGVIALSPPLDVRKSIERISTKPQWFDGFIFAYYLYRMAFRSKMKSDGIYPPFDNFRDYILKRSCVQYSISFDELIKKTDPFHFIDEIKVPVLILHSKDDPIIPVKQAFTFRNSVRGNPMIRVWITERGGHCAFSVVARKWFCNVLLQFYSYWTS